MIIPIIVLVAVFVLIAVRQIGNIRLQIWQVMLGGAVVVLLAGQISPSDAIKSVNIDIILFLFGMFVVGSSLEQSGYLEHLSYRLFKNAQSADVLLLLVIFSMGIASAFLMNDTLAIIGTPVMLLLAKQHRLEPKMLLFALAFSVTIGSVMSPIGNPQNLLIALHGEVAFATFFRYLLLPTLTNLFLAFLVLKFFYRKSFDNSTLAHFPVQVNDQNLARLCKISLFLIAVLVAAKILSTFAGISIDFRLTYIALIAALPIILFSGKRKEIVKKVDWHTLIFFAAMFVLMQSVWNSGFFQSFINGFSLTSMGVIFLVSVLLSQFISNVPLVALYMPLLLSAGATVKELTALAAGSTIAGNLFILGAASNVIIIQNAEKNGVTITFRKFAKVGVPLTIMNVFVYWVFLSFV